MKIRQALLILIIIFLFAAALPVKIGKKVVAHQIVSSFHNLLKPLPSPSPSPSPSPLPPPSPSPSPSPSPLTFAEMQQLYGPCTITPTLMYHHIQDSETAKAANQSSLTVFPDVFQRQMQYLADHGYQPVTTQDLVNFFDAAVAPPTKSVLLTFDDAYGDFYTTAYPILRAFGFRTTVFVPTGLVNNPGYLSWDQVNEMKGSGLVSFGNHTWSHKNMFDDRETDTNEIVTADTQLTERGLNSPKVFAFPFGPASGLAQQILSEQGYSLAFTTVPGGILCRQQRLGLPRIRIGNADLSAYGF